MRKVYCVIVLCLFMCGVSAQNIASINGKPIANKEFMWFYKKNHLGSANASYTDLEAYLNQYINFKLKVLEAREWGLDKDTSYLNEVKDYEDALRAQKRVSKKNTAYSFIINEYKEAALMFNISEKKVWEKAQNDEIQLRAFYDKNKNVYLQSSFEDIKGQVISDYQQSLENEWIASLKKRYSVKINQNEIRKLAKL